jgi:hypothetical protein
MNFENVCQIPSRVKNLTGVRFEKLVVLRFLGVEKTHAVWWCKCDCGTEKKIKAKHLVAGATKSCGCFARDFTIKRSIIHGHTVDSKISPTYQSWRSMIARCKYEHTNDYKNYGGRGITVCDQWIVFENFLNDMGDRPKNYCLDRIDFNGNYEPSNCRWVSTKESARNKSTNHLVEFNGDVHLLVTWSEKTGIPEDTLWHRLFSAKWPVEKALTTPLRKRKDSRGNNPGQSIAL